MQIDQLITASRSFRRFDDGHRIEESTLRELIELARKSPSGANRQPLKFHISSDAGLNERIYPALAWAGYLKNWDGPVESERPTAYITLLLDRTIAQSAGVDHGIAAQSILLGAADRGLGGCMIASVKKKELLSILGLDGKRFEVLMVIALGKPVEKVVLDEIGPDGRIEYWRDAEGVHHVPKRSLDSLIV
jgi:nitroreductase